MATRAQPQPMLTGLPADVRLMNFSAGLLAVIGGVALLGAALLGIARLPVFALHSIRIEGDVTRNSVSTIRANAAPHLAGNFFTLDLARAQRAFEAVPWVRQAVVRRVWPNELVVQLEEHHPVALWEGAEGTEDADDKLVNSFGEVFEANVGDVEDDGLPTLRGTEANSPHMLALLGRLVPVFAKLDMRIETLALSGRGSWRAELDSGAAIELGRGNDDEVVARTERFIATLPRLLEMYEQRPLESADLRHNEGYAVRLRGITTAVIANDPQHKPKPAPKN